MITLVERPRLVNGKPEYDVMRNGEYAGWRVWYSGFVMSGWSGWCFTREPHRHNRIDFVRELIAALDEKLGEVKE